MLIDSQNNKNILHFAEIIIVLSIVISGYLLFTYERKNHNPDYNKDWVAFYYADLNVPENGVIAENHSGKNTDFKFCLVPDNVDLMEPNDLSCNADLIVDSSDKRISAGSIVKWQYKKPETKGKYWVVLEYKDGDVLKSKNLSFEI